MPSILFWNYHAIRRSSSSSSSIDKFSGPLSSFSSNNKNKHPSTSSSHQETKSYNNTQYNNDIPALLGQSDHVKIHCDHTLFQTVLSRQEDDELLWCLAKRLKQQEDREELDRVDVIVGGNDTTTISTMHHHTQGICYRRAIRILIYYFRAHHHHPKYFKKCINVPEPCCCSPNVQETISEIQHAATSAMTPSTPPSPQHQQQHHANKLTLSSRSMSVSSYSTTSSYASSTASNCSHCGIEKRAMPVCARCKSQAYCSNKCRKAHQPIHQRECNTGQ
ncbi:hypothetical protein BDA99DRAFT_522674 [Phascolomyces articulosus]|uniref:MYND-type domain-containing protein n=1 Tax=Phascolomyces articulosus TaxID=60185 RepID=A0AAD5JR38_9FUNG|nr:hypothetical protein BDA99DRAFT_522674 [Phascolomyces articulosus]